MSTIDLLLSCALVFGLFVAQCCGALFLWLDGTVILFPGALLGQRWQPMDVLWAYELVVGALTSNRSHPLRSASEQLLAFAFWRLVSTGHPGTLDEDVLRSLESLFGTVDTNVSAPTQVLQLAERALDVMTIRSQYNTLPTLVPSFLQFEPLRHAARTGEYALMWRTGVPPRVVLPHCAVDEFAAGFAWEGVSLGSARVWLPRVVARLHENERTNSFFAVRTAGPVSEPCQAVGNAIFHDPTRCLQESGWDGIALTSHPSHPKAVLEVFSSAGLSPKLGLFNYLRGDRRLNWERIVGEFEGENVSLFVPQNDATLQIDSDAPESLTSMIHTPDVMFLSPLAGNCQRVAQLVFASTNVENPRLTGTHLPRILIVPMNPLLVPPVRATPNFTRWWLHIQHLGQGTAAYQQAVIMGQCSLQSAADVLAPAYTPLFVDVSLAVFVQHALVERFEHERSLDEETKQWTSDDSGNSSEAPCLEAMWRRGAGCAWPILQLFVGHDAPADQASALEIPGKSCALLEEVFKKHDYSLEGSELSGCSEPLPPEPLHVYLAGRELQLGDRGRCIREIAMCECFPPWRGAVCDVFDGPRKAKAANIQSSGPDAGNVIFTLVGPQPERLDELRWALKNWWEAYNSQYDYPVIIFHDGLPRKWFARLRAGSQNRIWFAYIVGFKQRAPPGVGDLNYMPEGYRNAIRFLSRDVFDQPALARTKAAFFLATDSYFPQQLANDPVTDVVNAGAVLGWLYKIREPSFVIRHLFDVALMFQASVLNATADDDVRASGPPPMS